MAKYNRLRTLPRQTLNSKHINREAPKPLTETPQGSRLELRYGSVAEAFDEAEIRTLALATGGGWLGVYRGLGFKGLGV